MKGNYKLIAIDLSKQKALDADPKKIKQINFTENVDPTEEATMYFNTERATETILDFSKGTVRTL